MPASPEIFARYMNPTFIETGTWHGDGVAFALQAGFSDIHSVELSSRLYTQACRRFAAYSAVRLYKGDSPEALQSILSGLTTPATFWLDAHYSEGDTARGSVDSPLLAELAVIQQHSITDHTILVDDVRLLGKDFPFTFGNVLAELHRINQAYRYEIIMSGIWELGPDILVASPV